MNILLISSADPFKKAGVEALDLFKGLKKYNDLNVKLLTKHTLECNGEIISFESGFEVYRKRVFRFFKKRLFLKGNITNDKAYHFLDVDQTENIVSTKRILEKIAFKPDVILIVFMHNFLTFQNLKEFHQLTHAKIFLYPMDMGPFTGGCHYSLDCEKYKDGCGKCPALLSSEDTDNSYLNLRFKKSMVKNIPLTLLACNSQLKEQILSSSIFKKYTVLSGFLPVPDRSIFYPRDIISSRDHFKIPLNSKVLFFGAASISDRRKGMEILTKALTILKEKLLYENPSIFLLIAGGNSIEILEQLPFPYLNIGFISDFGELALAYSAADFHLSPSIEDSGPTMVLQSMLCHTPVVSFDIGYSKDLIYDAENGFKTQLKNEQSFSECIFRAVSLNDEEYLEMLENLKKVEISLDYDKVLQKLYDAFNPISIEALD